MMASPFEPDGTPPFNARPGRAQARGPGFTAVVRWGADRGWAELPLDDGRVLLVFDPETATAKFWRGVLGASELLRDAGVVAPASAAREPAAAGQLRALFRPGLPTLAELWPSLSADARRAALRSAGALIRRIHDVRLAGFGPLDPARPGGQPLQWVLAHELGAQGFPAVAEACPAALGVVEGLLETIPEVASRAEASPRLTHNGLHLGILLCRPDPDSPGVVGIADPGDPGGGPPESDLAHVQLAHGPLFGQPLEPDWFDELLEGYGAEPDAVVLAFFRAVHLVRRLVARGRSEGTGAAEAWIDAAAGEMELVHAAYEARVRATAASAGIPASEATALLPRPAARRRRKAGPG